MTWKASIIVGRVFTFVNHPPPPTGSVSIREPWFQFFGPENQNQRTVSSSYISTTSKNRWVSWKNQQGYKSGSLIFFVPFLRAMVIYPNLCNHSSQQWKNQVTKFITAGSLLDPIDSNPHCCYVWMEPKETRKKGEGLNLQALPKNWVG